MDKIKDLRREIFNEMNTWPFSAEKKEKVKQMVDQMVEEADIVEDKAYDREYDEGFSIAYSRNAFN